MQALLTIVILVSALIWLIFFLQVFVNVLPEVAEHRRQLIVVYILRCYLGESYIIVVGP